MVVYLQSIFFLKFLASCHLHYLIHISEIHALIQNKKESGSFWKGGISGKAETLEKRNFRKEGS